MLPQGCRKRPVRRLETGLVLLEDLLLLRSWLDVPRACAASSARRTSVQKALSACTRRFSSACCCRDSRRAAATSATTPTAASSSVTGPLCWHAPAQHTAPLRAPRRWRAPPAAAGPSSLLLLTLNHRPDGVCRRRLRRASAPHARQQGSVPRIGQSAFLCPRLCPLSRTSRHGRRRVDRVAQRRLRPGASLALMTRPVLGEHRAHHPRAGLGCSVPPHTGQGSPSTR